MKDKVRFEWVDIVKGIGIILVLLGHRDATFGVYSYIYSFHMALFFFISGFTFSDEKQQNVLGYIMVRAKRLLIPYFIFSLLSFPVIYLQNAHPSSTIHKLLPFIDSSSPNFTNTLVDGYFDLHGTALWNVPLWFLPCLFVTEVSFYLLVKLIKFLAKKSDFFKFNSSLGLCLIVISIIGFSINTPWMFNANLAFMTIIFFGMGYLLKLKNIQVAKSTNSIFVMTLCIMISVFIGYYVNTTFHLNLDIAINVNTWKYIAGYICAISAIAAVVIVSNVIKSSVLVYLGRNTLFIMSTHLIIFWLMQSVEKYYGLNFYNNSPSGLFKSLVYTVICLLVSYPCIEICNRFLPFLVGRSNTQKQLGGKHNADSTMAENKTILTK